MIWTRGKSCRLVLILSAAALLINLQANYVECHRSIPMCRGYQLRCCTVEGNKPYFCDGGLRCLCPPNWNEDDIDDLDWKPAHKPINPIKIDQQLTKCDIYEEECCNVPKCSRPKPICKELKKSCKCPVGNRSQSLQGFGMTAEILRIAKCAQELTQNVIMGESGVPQACCGSIIFKLTCLCIGKQ